MNYELALKLKEAGFPQEDRHWYFCTFTYPTTLWCINALKEKKLYKEYEYMTASPTLEELIEACGDIVLFKIPKGNEWNSSLKDVWIADDCGNNLCADTYFIDEQIDGIEGKTPTEAVANLWLELNKK